MSWYFWDPKTDTITPTKYDILEDPEELWGPELLAVTQSREKNYRVAESTIRGFWLSTVFLGLDHSFMRVCEPVLFETMIHDECPGMCQWLHYQRRYCTGKEARAGHEKIDKVSRWLLLKAPQVSNSNFRKVVGEL